MFTAVWADGGGAGIKGRRVDVHCTKASVTAAASTGRLRNRTPPAARTAPYRKSISYAETGVPHPPDLPTDDRGQRRDQELTSPELTSDWNVLPVVLGDREQAEPSTALPVPLPATAPKDLMSPEEVADELTTLAGVEHALCVEYL